MRDFEQHKTPLICPIVWKDREVMTPGRDEQIDVTPHMPEWQLGPWRKGPLRVGEWSDTFGCVASFVQDKAQRRLVRLAAELGGQHESAPRSRRQTRNGKR